MNHAPVLILLACLALLLGPAAATAQEVKSDPPFQRVVIDEAPPKQPYYKLVGDLTGDGKPEIVVGGRVGPLVMYSPPDWNKTIIAEGGYDGGVNGDLADFDQGGRLDVAYAEMHQGTDPDEVVVLLNRDGGAMWERLILDEAGSHDIVAADVTGDGAPDIIGANHDGVHPVVLWRNQLRSRAGE